MPILLITASSSHHVPLSSKSSGFALRMFTASALFTQHGVDEDTLQESVVDSEGGDVLDLLRVEGERLANGRVIEGGAHSDQGHVLLDRFRAERV